jgi:AraC family transcriptional regulator
MMSEASSVEAATPIAPVRREQCEAMLIAGLGGTYAAATVPQIPALWQRFEPQIDSVPGMIGTETYGVVTGMAGDEDSFRYLCGVQVTDAEGLPADFEVIAVPRQTYVKFVHSGHVSELPATCHAIWHEWLPGSDERPTGTPAFIEVYGDRFDPTTGKGEIEVWIPVEA